MCGLAGFLVRAHSRGAEDMRAQIHLMTNTLQHRGPNDAGEWIDVNAGIAIGHRRLSILDLSAHAHQPMTSASGRFVIAYNGELYNFKDLRRRIDAASPVTWRSHSDTEVMLAAFDLWGVDEALALFNGMFAIALWDRRDNVLLLMRDRFGEKPLYYSCDNDTVIFGSELKALRAHVDWRNELDHESIRLYQLANYIPEPKTIYKHAQAVPQGTYVTVRMGGHDPEVTAPKTYWSALTTALHSRRRPLDIGPATTSNLLRLLTDSVALRLESDVPVGAFLSGGVDSALTVAVMQSIAQRPTRTFTIQYADNTYDESAAAQAIADHLRTDHSSHMVTARDALDAFAALSRHADQPFADSSLIPTYLVSKAAREHVTVALTGDGGDELFGGYHRYFVGQRAWSQIQSIPQALRSVAPSLLSSLSPRQWDRVLIGWRALTHKPWADLSGDRLHTLAAAMSARNSKELYGALLWRESSHTNAKRRARATTYDELLQHAGAVFDSEELTTVESMMLADTIGLMNSCFLSKVDRASMAVGLETRAPLLDPRLFEFAWRLPLKAKIGSGHGKLALRELLRQFLPDTLIEKQKRGFGVPIGIWLRGPLREWAEALIYRSKTGDMEHTEGRALLKTWREHLSGSHNHERYLWRTLVLQDWLNNHFHAGRKAHGDCASRLQFATAVTT